MRFISTVFVLGWSCVWCTEKLCAETKDGDQKGTAIEPAATNRDDPSPPSSEAGEPKVAKASDPPQARAKSLDGALNLKVDGIDYNLEKTYSVAKRERARELFTRGKLLYEAKDFAGAAEAFKLAYETLPHQAVLGNIALCYDRAGKWPNAVVYYRKYFLDPVEHKENRQMRERLKELNALVGEMIVKCEVDDCDIRVDGMSQGTAPVEVVVLPGEHRIEAVVDGEVVDDTVMAIEARDILTVEFDDIGASKARPTPSPEETAPPVVASSDLSSIRLGFGFWAAAGVTVGSGVVAAVFGGLTVKAKLDYEEADRSDAELRERGRKLRLTTNIMAGVTGAAAVLAITLAVVDVSRSKKKERQAVTLAPGPGLGVAVGF